MSRRRGLHSGRVDVEGVRQQGEILFSGAREVNRGKSGNEAFLHFVPHNTQFVPHKECEAAQHNSGHVLLADYDSSTRGEMPPKTSAAVQK